MKKSIWLMVILVVMAGGVYTYVFFSSKKVTKASNVPSCCTEVTTLPEQTASTPKEGCSLECPTGVTACPSSVPAVSSAPQNKVPSTPPSNTEPCDNCVCDTDEECPNEDKCDACLEEEQRQGNKKESRESGTKNGGQHRKGQNNKR
jgi:hypothetical protein